MIRKTVNEIGEKGESPITTKIFISNKRGKINNGIERNI